MIKYKCLNCDEFFYKSAVKESIETCPNCGSYDIDCQSDLSEYLSGSRTPANAPAENEKYSY